jgi:hypothetical protein
MEATVQRTSVKQVNKRNQLTAEQQALIADAEALLAKGNRMMEDEVNHVRQQLGGIPETINLSYVAKQYFGKSRAWLYQRMNGNKVNGKTAFFTRAERKKLEEALHDIGKQLLDIKLV